jgi:hypothetical protein
MVKGQLDAIARSFHDRLKSERPSTERRLAALQTLLQAADSAADRYDNYEALLRENEPPCPRCWMYCEQKNPLRQFDDPAHEEAYRCDKCGKEYCFFPVEAS